jgi:hypothetical protein
LHYPVANDLAKRTRDRNRQVRVLRQNRTPNAANAVRRRPRRFPPLFMPELRRVAPEQRPIKADLRCRQKGKRDRVSAWPTISSPSIVNSGRVCCVGKRQRPHWTTALDSVPYACTSGGIRSMFPVTEDNSERRL